ncbi:MAG: DUF3108 domain-containing protein [Pontiella sp.]
MKLLTSFLSLCLLPGLACADYRFPIGERATYKIQWGLLSCGSSTISCDEVELDGKALIRIRVEVKSNWLVSSVYPVDDTVNCYIDPETLLSVRLEKNTSEGNFICKDVLKLDRINNEASWFSTSQNISTNYPIQTDSCDAVSFLYAFRQHSFKQNESRDFNIAVDSALHGISITAGKTGKKAIGKAGKENCRRYAVTPKRDDLFVRKIPLAIWLTEDERKIMARMDVKVPIGKARIVLDEYIPPFNRDESL